MKKNIVYIYASGKTESLHADFGFIALEDEMQYAIREHNSNRAAAGQELARTIIFVQDGMPISFCIAPGATDSKIIKLQP